MSKLNAQAFAFVPGAFKFAPPQQAAQSQPPPSEEPVPVSAPTSVEEAPPKVATTVSINISGPESITNSETDSTALPSVEKHDLTSISTQAVSAVPQTSTAKATPTKADVTISSKSQDLLTEKSRTDADAIVHELQKHADSEILDDLFGKQHLNIVFIGHVDAGKSTMGGNLLYITGMVDKRTMEKYEREAKELGRDSWYLSWALDSTPQERAKV